ncbi:hypothetical protein ACFL5Z_01925 [Planctomycetota bacterium]
MKRLLLTSLIVGLMACSAMGQKVKSFCEYGTGVALQLGAGGALWDQTWGEEAWEWYECDATPNVGFLNKNVVGQLGTTTAGPPQIDSDWVLRFDFGGWFVLTANDDNEPDKTTGQIFGDVAGTFVADLNAGRAVVDEEAGTITIAFGADLHDDPDALITVTETTGKFKSIEAVGPWEWYVSGTITIALIEGLPLQTNILAGLGDNTLLLGAEEEIVLSGSYYRSSPGE